MEIVFFKTEKRSNFDYYNKLFKNTKILNGFNKLNESLISESIISNDYECQNVLFTDEIKADLYIAYPLSVVIKQPIKFKSLYELIDCIRNTYKQIYKEDNINDKNKNYGIWGHSIYDLQIETISVLQGAKGVVVKVGIGS